MSFQENSLWFLCKVKAIQGDVGIFMHIKAYSDIFKHKRKYSQAHSEHSVTLAYSVPKAYSEPCFIQKPDIFRTLVYSETWYIQSPDIFRTLLYSEPWYIQNSGIFKTLVYSERWYIQNPVKHGGFSRK